MCTHTLVQSIHVQASVISDVVVLYILKYRKYYHTNKYLLVTDPVNDYEPLDNSNSEDDDCSKPVNS